jgi:hypothetical protein
MHDTEITTKRKRRTTKPPPLLLTRRVEASRALKLSVSNVDGLIRAGALPVARIGRRVFVEPASLHALIERSTRR